MRRNPSDGLLAGDGDGKLSAQPSRRHLRHELGRRRRRRGAASEKGDGFRCIQPFLVSWRSRQLQAESRLYKLGVKMGGRTTGILYAASMAAIVVAVDLLFFRNRFWERLMANIGIVLVFAAFYFRFLKT